MKHKENINVFELYEHQSILKNGLQIEGLKIIKKRIFENEKRFHQNS